MKVFYTALGFFFLLPFLAAQMPGPDGTVRYGHEWIRPEGGTYLRVAVAQDGAYRIDPSQLAALGWSATGPEADRLQLWHHGERVPIYVNEQGVHFFGEQNRGEFDRYLFSDPDAQQLNPRYSMFTDTAVYYLGVLPEGEEETRLRFEEALHDPDAGTPEVPFVWRVSERVYDDHPIKAFERIVLNPGIPNSPVYSVYYSHFTTTEGYGSRSEADLLSPNGTMTSSLTLNAPNAVMATEAPTLDLRFGVGFDQHRQVLSLDNVETDSFVNTGWAVRAGQWDILNSSLSDAKLDIVLRGMAGNRDKASLAFAKLRYPAQTTTAGTPDLRFEVATGTESATLVLNSVPGSGTAYLFDLSTQQRYEAPVTEGQVRFTLPAFAESHSFHLVTSAGWRSTAAASQSIFFPALSDQPVNLKFLILTTERLLQAGNAVESYADYRSSAAGGDYRVHIATVEDLYERHGYGIARHPQAIRNYLQWMRSEHPELQYLLIIGKGREYQEVRTAGQLANAQETFFVPTFGYPASDNLLSSVADAYLPTLATGRLTAIDNHEVEVYLDKLQFTESSEDDPQTIEGKLWTKNVLHLGGGTTPGERGDIKRNLDDMGRILERGTFAANLTSFYKTSSDPIENSRTEQIFNVINSGTSIITFFGHSSVGTFDFSIDTPQEYDNEGKNPLMLSLGCYSGNHFISSKSIGERFLLLPKNGAIAFAASRGLGFTGSLAELGKNYYRNASEVHYGDGIGDILRSSLASIYSENNLYTLSLVEQFSLQGDPAFKLHPHEGPDFVFDADHISVSPKFPSVQLDSFRLNFRVVNIGRANSNDSLINISVRQQLPGGRIINHPTTQVPIAGSAFDHSVRVENIGEAAVGRNVFLLSLDPSNEIIEEPQAAENNNQLVNKNGLPGFEVFVIENTVTPVYPPEYAIVGSIDSLRLYADVSDKLVGDQDYYFQLTDDPNFNSIILDEKIASSDALVEWPLNYPLKDSTVYYWRVSTDTLSNIGAGPVWEASSFSFLNEERAGWSHGNRGQWRDNVLVNIKFSPDSTNFTFADNVLDVDLRNKIDDPEDRPYFNDNGNNISSPWLWSIEEGLNVIVITYPELKYWRNPFGGRYESVNTADGSYWRNHGVLPFSYPTENIHDRENLIIFLEEIVPDSFYVIVYSAQKTDSSDYHPELWAMDSTELEGNNIFNILEKQGASLIRNTEDLGALPYVFFYQKGVNKIGESLASNLEGDASIRHLFRGKWYEGNINSVAIGPARSWSHLKMSYASSNLSLQSDSISLDLFGITSSSDTVLLRTIASFEPGIEYDISDLSADEYPYLTISLFASDYEFRTIPPLNRLSVIYEGLPDLAIAEGQRLGVEADTIERGANYGLSFRIKNLSKYTIPPTTMSYVLTQSGTLSSDFTTENIPSLPPLGEIQDTIILSTAALSGSAQFTLRINPDNQPKERVRSNNILTDDFGLDEDVIDPVLSVSFDGQAILSGDIVSPNPHIRIDISDENDFLRIIDPELVQVSIKYPDDPAFQAINPNEYDWTPASPEGDNKASIQYQPSFSVDGIYQLQIAAKDVTGNQAGKLLYETSFEVINERTISNVLPYPNPFSTRTRFVYTLTGAEPTDFRIQILTISGRIVREINKTEIGPMRIGTHQTEFEWDGRDQFGDRLANGVYLYRVIAKDENGAAYEMRKSAVDQFFQNGIGKIVLLR